MLMMVIIVDTYVQLYLALPSKSARFSRLREWHPPPRAGKANVEGRRCCPPPGPPWVTAVGAGGPSRRPCCPLSPLQLHPGRESLVVCFFFFFSLGA